jgi:UDPglucose 6-dehydrogenase
MSASILNIGIIGSGFVGKATQQLNHSAITLFVYDVVPELCNPIGMTMADLRQCDIIFVCVPTPMETSGKCHLGIVESVMRDLSKVIDPSKNFVVLRSTVPPGTCDRFKCYFMPEFLTEKNYIQDFINCEDWIVGLADDPSTNVFCTRMTQLFQSAKAAGKIKHDLIIFLSNKEAELVKYFRNTFLSVKVAFCNEMEEFCRRQSIDYSAVRTAATLDSRIGASHTVVPGHDGKRGFGGTCFPKDMNALLYEMKSIGMTSYVLQGAIDRNTTVDRNEEDWKEDKGRAVV